MNSFENGELAVSFNSTNVYFFVEVREISYLEDSLIVNSTTWTPSRTDEIWLIVFVMNSFERFENEFLNFYSTIFVTFLWIMERYPI